MIKTIFVFGFYILFLSSAMAQGMQLPAYTGRVNTGPQEQWQLTFDVIKSNVQTLVKKNDELMSNFRSLSDQINKLKKFIQDQEMKNEEIKKFLKDRRGKTDQQIRIELLINQLKLKKKELAGIAQKAGLLKDQAAVAAHQVEAMKSKISEIELYHNVLPKPPAEASSDPELDQLRQELEAQKVQEAMLDRKVSPSMRDPQIRALHDQLDALAQQKSQLLKKTTITVPLDFSQGRYVSMIARKSQLESMNHVLAARANAMRDPSSKDASWVVQRKAMVHDVVAADAANARARAEINRLREDIALLKAQINVLESKVRRD